MASASNENKDLPLPLVSTELPAYIPHATEATNRTDTGNVPDWIESKSTNEHPLHAFFKPGLDSTVRDASEWMKSKVSPLRQSIALSTEDVVQLQWVFLALLLLYFKRRSTPVGKDTTQEEDVPKIQRTTSECSRPTPLLVTSLSQDGSSDYDTDSLTSNDELLGSREQYHQGNEDFSRSLFGGRQIQGDLEVETFENEPVQEIVEEQTMTFVRALSRMVQSSTEEGKQSVQALVQQEIQDRERAMEKRHQEQYWQLAVNLQTLQGELKMVQHGAVQGLVARVSQLEAELQQERSILDKAVVTHYHNISDQKTDVTVLRDRMQSLETSLQQKWEQRVGQLEQELKKETETAVASHNEDNQKNTMDRMQSLLQEKEQGWQERLEQLDRELRGELKQNEAKRDERMLGALEEMSGQVQDLEEEMIHQKDVQEATLSIFEHRADIHKASQDKTLAALEAQVKTVSKDLERVEQENKASISVVETKLESQDAKINSRLQALEDELASCQEEWKTILQGLESLDNNLSGYKQSQEKATGNLNSQIRGLQWEIEEARTVSLETQEMIQAMAASAKEAIMGTTERKSFQFPWAKRSEKRDPLTETETIDDQQAEAEPADWKKWSDVKLTHDGKKWNVATSEDQQVIEDPGLTNCQQWSEVKLTHEGKKWIYEM